MGRAIGTGLGVCLCLIKGTTSRVLCICISPCGAVGDTVSGCTGSSSLSGLAIGVLSVSCSSELLMSFAALWNTSTHDHFKSTET